jgi:two-component system phosphate regulon sensor histidine kinase PhoR
METYVMIEITDNGDGINEVHLSRLFERFYRVDTDRNRKKGGSGFGLSIVKKILEAHGQSIQVESTVGKGTRFTFTLEKA